MNQATEATNAGGLSERIGLPRLDRPGSGTLVLATWIDAVGSGLFFTFYLLYLNKIAGFSLGTAGLVLSITAGIALAFNPIAGSLVDRTGAKPMMLFSQILCAIGYTGLLFVEGSVPRLAVFALVASLGDRIFWVGFPTLVAQIAKDHERDKWFAFLGMTREAGFGVGGLAAASIIWLLGDDGYRVLIAINGLSFALAAFLIATRVPPPVPVQHEGDHGGWKAVLRDRPVVKMALANVMAACAIMTGFLAWPVYVVDHLQMGEWLPGIMFALATLILATCQAVALRIVAGWRRTRVYAFAAVLWVIGAIFFALAQIVPPSALLLYVLFCVAFNTIGDVFQANQTNGFPSALAPAALRGRYLALFSFSWGLARTIAPGIVAALLWLGPTYLWIGVIIFCFGMGGMALWAEQGLDPEKQRMPRQLRTEPAEILAGPEAI